MGNSWSVGGDVRTQADHPSLLQHMGMGVVPQLQLSILKMMDTITDYEKMKSHV